MWFTAITSVIQILLILLRSSERSKIVAEVEAVERAKVINEINKTLLIAAQVPAELGRLSDKELDRYVHDKGWYRD
jgi:hypothetical protein